MNNRRKKIYKNIFRPNPQNSFSSHKNGAFGSRPVLFSIQSTLIVKGRELVNKENGGLDRENRNAWSSFRLNHDFFLRSVCWSQRRRILPPLVSCLQRESKNQRIHVCNNTPQRATSGGPYVPGASMKCVQQPKDTAYWVRPTVPPPRALASGRGVSRSLSPPPPLLGYVVVRTNMLLRSMGTELEGSRGCER